MPDLSQLLIFVGVVALLFISPGPAVLLTLARSVSSGTKVGIATGAGIAVGDMLHTLAAVAGLSAILMTSAWAYELVKYAGAAYLIYLGFMAMRKNRSGVDIPNARQITAWPAFRQAILIEILNPKTALFFLSFLPQFTDPSHGGIWLQLLVLGAVFVTMSMFYTSLLAIFAARASGWLNRGSFIAKWQGKLVGSIYIALGLQLALQDRR
ncbi:MAG TPA: LysE family translocator [Hyphomicrobiales bacterium]|nr:LysE family translocator [Hyphomicrobiales bacterium]